MSRAEQPTRSAVRPVRQAVNGAPDILRTAVDAVIPLVVLFALHLLLVGHDEPGGGFVAGLLAAGALAVDAIAHRGDAPGDGALRARLPSTETLVAVGLVMAAGVALLPMLGGGSLLDSSGISTDLGPFGTLKVTTVLVFDIGVFAIVVGFATAVLDRVREVVS